MNFKKIHQEILKRSSKYNIIKNEIKKNGIIKIQKSRLDLFTFITKTIISQQISDKVAQSLWKKFCLSFKTEYPSKNDIKNNRDHLDSLKGKSSTEWREYATKCMIEIMDNKV